MIQYLTACFLLISIIACQPAYKTSYGIKNSQGEILDLRSTTFVLGTPAEIERLYAERVKQKTEGDVILKSMPLPQYPRDMLEAGIDGEVYIEFSVNKKGYVENPQVMWSSNKKFTEPSLKALKKWRFEPVLKNGKTVAARLKHAFIYKIGQ